MKSTARYELQPKKPLKIITYHFVDHAKIWRHWHEYLEIIFLVHGKFRLKSDDNVFDASDGDIIVFNSFEIHESIQLSENNEYYVFIVPPEFTGVWNEENEFKIKNIIIGDEDCRSALRRAAECVNKSSENNDFLLNSYIFRFLHYASVNHSFCSSRPAELTEKNRYMVEDIKNRILSCYSEPINVELLANAFFVSVSHLQHTFKQHTGMSIVDFINKTRVENSKKLLRETKLHISAIAEKVGIYDYNYFSRVFKKYAGISPTQYRKNVLHGEKE